MRSNWPATTIPLRFALLLTLAVGVVGCTGTLDKLRKGYDAVEAGIQSKVAGTVVPRLAIGAIATYDAAEVLATKYTRLPRCTGDNGPFCRDPAYRTRIDAGIYAGRAARNNIKAFMRAHADQTPVPGDLIDAITTATSTIEDATSAYKAALAQPTK